MRACFASKMLSLTGLFLFLAVAGCQSTSLSPLARDSAANGKDSLANSFAWKKSNAPPSAAAAPERWNGSAKFPVSLVATSFQEPGAQAQEQPIPELFIKNSDDPIPRLQLPAQPVSFRHGAKAHGNPAVTLAPPNAPNEANPTLLPEYMIRPPDVLLIESQKGLLTQPVRGQHLVRPDGSVSLGIYPPATVAGRTVLQAREEIAKSIYSRMSKEPQKTEKGDVINPPTFQDVLNGLSVDVLAYNSSVYYIITDGAGLGEQVYRFPATGNETVLDAIAHINGLPVVASTKRIWVARRNVGMPAPDNILPVDWRGITQGGAMNTNWQVMPGDRIYVQADPMRRFNITLAKMLEPIERIMGVTLLSGQTVNTIRNGNNSVNNGLVR
jgi:polysaccharide biosynthesis/export protein